MGSRRSKEDDVNRISISIYVTNFPENFSAKELFQSCKQYGHVVDSFIPRKRTKEVGLILSPLPNGLEVEDWRSPKTYLLLNGGLRRIMWELALGSRKFAKLLSISILMIIFRGKVYWDSCLRRSPGWSPWTLVEDSDEEELSDDDSLEEGMKNLESENDCSNSFEVPDTVFENEEEKLNEDDGDSNNSNLKENVDESASFGRFKKSVAPSSGGSFMCLMEEVVKVGQTMGYNMDGVINNLSDIIESQGASIVDR
ncbi:nucleotide-binding alpha-beta plait domain-containing protein [Tanacetum coccineum]